MHTYPHPGPSPFTSTTADPVCVTKAQIADPADPNNGNLRIKCDVPNKATDDVIFYTMYMNGILLVAAGKQELANVSFGGLVFINSPGEIDVTYNKPMEFNAFGTYTCVGSSLWGRSNRTITFGYCSEFQWPLHSVSHTLTTCCSFFSFSRCRT